MSGSGLPPASCPFGYVDPGEAVEAGRRGLDHWWRYPWYDRAADDLQRIDVAWPWWLDWLPDWRGFGLPSWPGSLLEWLAWIAIAALLTWLVWVLVRTFRARRRAGGKDGPGGRTGMDGADERRRVEAIPFPAPGRELDLLAEAERCYRKGDYGTAVLYLFGYQLVQLDRRRLIRLAKGKTNRQYLRELGRRAPLRRLVEQTMVAFEDVLFGHYSLDRARFESCWGRLGEFESLAAEAEG